MASRPILAGKGDGPIRGTVVMGRILDRAEVRKIARRTHVAFTAHRFDDPNLPAAFKAALPSLADGKRIGVQPLDSRLVSGFALLQDIYGKPALVLRANLSRHIYDQGRRRSSYFLWALVGVGVLFGGLTIVVLERSVLRPVAGLTKGLADLHIGGDLSGRVSVRGGDELSRLGEGINHLLGRVQASHRDVLMAKERLEALVDTSARITSVLELEGILERIVEEAFEAMGADRGSVYLSGEGNKEGRYLAARGLSREFLDELENLKERLSRREVLQAGEPILIHDAVNDPRQQAVREWVEREGLRSALILPLRVRGKIIGAMTFCFDTLQELGPDLVATSQAFADQAAIAIDNSRLFAEVQRRATNLEILEEIAKGVNSTLELEALFKIAVEQVRRLAPCVGSALYAIDEKRKSITDYWTVDINEPREGWVESRRNLTGSQYERLFETHAPLYTPDTRDGPYARLLSLASQGLLSVVTVPVLSEGSCIGALSVVSEQVDAFTPEHIDLLVSVADHLAIAMKNAELYAQVRETGERLDNLVRSATDGILTVNAEGVVTSWNPGAEALYGHTAREAVGKNVLNLLARDPGPRDRMMTYRNRLIAEEEVSPIETVMHRKDGAPLEVSISLSTLRDQDGEFEGFIAIHRDIGAQKRTEQALRESEERFRSLVEQAADAVFVHGLDGRFVDVNQQACDTLGYSREELLKLSVGEIDVNFNDEMLERMWKTVEDGKTLTIEGMHRRKNGETFPVEIRLGLIQSGGHRRILALARDITERIRAQEMLLRNEKLASLGRLTAGAAHEILNPANIIGMHAQGLIRTPQDPSAVRKSCETIYQSVKRIAKICGGLRRFSREEDSSVTRFDILELIRDTLAMLEPQFRMAGPTYQLKLPETPITVEADRDQISQVFINLINNALDAMDQKGAVTLSAESVNRGGEPWVRCSVKDEGVGIPPEALPHIFDPFFTTKDVAEGTGLGLSIVHGIIENHGGRIDVQSEVGVGATFHVEVPRIAALPGA